MRQLLVSILLIGVVLACPFQCLGLPVADGLSTQSGSCCCGQKKKTGDEVPFSSENGSVCFCQGAIVNIDGEAELGLDAPVAVDWLSHDAVLSAVDSSITKTSLDPTHHFPPLSVGRDVCAMKCALLL